MSTYNKLTRQVQMHCRIMLKTSEELTCFVPHGERRVDLYSCHPTVHMYSWGTAVTPGLWKRKNRLIKLPGVLFFESVTHLTEFRGFSFNVLSAVQALMNTASTNKSGFLTPSDPLFWPVA